MKLIVLDDDPTGTQSATGVEVLLEWDAASLTEALRRADSVYLLTNTRAMHEPDAVALLERIRDERDAAAEALGEPVQVVLRGDSTLRGHVFPETSVFAGADAVILFVPAFPDGGRTTVDGTHYVRVGDRVIPAHESEYADDPVFPFGTAVLTEYVAEKSGRAAVHVPLRDIRSTRDRVARRARGRRSRQRRRARRRARRRHPGDRGRRARRLAGRRAASWCARRRRSPRSSRASRAPACCRPRCAPNPHRPCSSAARTPSARPASSSSSSARSARHPSSTPNAALDDPFAEGERIANAASTATAVQGLGIVASDRHRDGAHNTLDHGERVMTALTTATERLRGAVDVVVSKGGITSAEIARVGLGARTATVLGQLLPGVSAWRVETPEHEQKLYVVVPGNVGDPTTLVDVLAAVGVRQGHPAAHPELSASER